MASRTVTTYEDDIDGSESATTVRFSLDGIHFEIDLNEKHQEDLREALALYVGNARRAITFQASGTRCAGSSSAAAGHDYDPKIVRACAIDKGLFAVESPGAVAPVIT